MSEWFVYLVRMNTGNLYTGISTDVPRRFQEHQKGDLKGAKSLRGKGPLSLEFSAKVGNRSEASIIEAKIKKLPKGVKERIIKGELTIESLFKPA